MSPIRRLLVAETLVCVFEALTGLCPSILLLVLWTDADCCLGAQARRLRKPGRLPLVEEERSVVVEIGSIEKCLEVIAPTGPRSSAQASSLYGVNNG